MASRVSCTIGKDNEKYYFYRGRRISEETARKLRSARKARVGKCKRVTAAKAGSATKRRSSSKAKVAKAKAKVRVAKAKAKVRVAKVRTAKGKEAEVVFVEAPPGWYAAKGRSRTTSELPTLIFEGTVPKRSSSARRKSDLIVFEDVPAKRGSSARKSLPRPENLGAPPAPPSGSRRSSRAPQLINVLPIPVGATALPVAAIGTPSRRVASAPARRSTGSVQRRMSTRAHESAAVWKLEPFGSDVNDKIILIPAKRVDVIDRKQLLTPEYRHALYRRHNARPGTLVWVDKKTDEMLGEITRLVPDWDYRGWAIYGQKGIMKNLNVIRP